MKNRVSMNNLPQEILLSIFLRSDVESVLECKLVCKPWLKLIENHIIKSKSSARTHLDHRKSLLLAKPDENDAIRSGFLWLRKFDNRHEMLIREDVPMRCTLHYAEYDVDAKNKSYGIKSRIVNILPMKQKKSGVKHLVNLTSCNGLICAALPHHKLYDPTYVFNPVTREYVNLPMYNQTKGSTLVYNMVSGFGYSPWSDEYKVVRIYCKGNGSRWFQVFILGGDNWKEEKEIEHQLFHKVGPCSKGVYVDGKIHWLDNESRIVAFSLANEEFYHINAPPLVVTYTYHNRKTLSVLGDWLCLVDSQSDGFMENTQVNVWLLKKNNDGTWSWNKECTVEGETKPHYPRLVPLAVTKQGKVLFWQNERYVSCYDPETAVLERLRKDEIGYEYVDTYQAAPHINSFVSLKALGVKKCRRRIEYEVPVNWAS